MKTDSQIMVLSLETRDHIQDYHFRSLINLMEVLLAENIIEDPLGCQASIDVLQVIHKETGDLIRAMQSGKECAFLREHNDLGVKILRSIYDARVNCISVAS